MPTPIPLAPELRERIGDEISVGFGRNDIARRHNVSTGVVSKIARERGLWFKKCDQTGVASQARQIDMWAARVKREAELEDELLAIPPTYDGHESRQRKRVTYALYNLNRHHNGQYR